MRLRTASSLLSALCASLLGAPAVAQTTVQIGADLDNTLYDPIGTQSNGAGEHLFAGNTASGQIRRGLLRFDLGSAVPAGSVIQSVSLRLNMSMTMTGSQPVALHRALAEWGAAGSDAPGGEGGGTAAQAGDATWTQRFFPTTDWATVGGDFEATPSATRNVAGMGAYTWNSTAALVADVQSWVDGAAANDGWFVIGDESTVPSAKRFDSSDNLTANNRPRLTVTYLPNPCGTALVATEIVRLGTPPNPAALQPSASGPPRIGAAWNPRIDHTTFMPAAAVDVLLIGRTAVNLPAVFGTLLVDLTPPTITLTAAPGVPFALPIPSDCALLGLQRFAQGASVDPTGVLEVTNALDLTIGNL